MAESNREASVRLTLDGSDFVVSIKQAGDAVAETDKKIKQAQSAWSKGFDGAKAAVGGLASQVGNLIKTAGGLAGAFSVGAAATRAIGLREQFRDLEFAINKTGKAQVEWNALYQQALDVSQKTGEGIEGIGAAMQSVFAATGDADFTRASIQAIGDAASATGEDINGWGNAAQLLQRKFGATGDTIADMMAVVVEKTGAGGLSLTDMSAKFGLLAGEAVDAGFKGKEGLSALLGVLTQLDSRVGEKSVPGLKVLFQALKDGSSELKALSKESGVTFEEGTTAIEKVQQLLQTDRGRKALEGKLTGETRVVFDELVKPFDAAFAQAKETGADVEEATKEGIRAFDSALKEMSKSTFSAAQLAEEGAGAVFEDPRVKLDQAVLKLTDALLQPELISAIDKLADKLPIIAEWIGKMVKFAVDHPGLAAAGVIGGTGIKGAAGAVLGGIDWKGIIWNSGAAKKAGDEAGEAMAKSAGGALARGGLTAAGKVFAVAVAAELAYEIGKAAIDSDSEADNARRNDVAMANVASAGGVDKKAKREALEKARAALADMQQEMGGQGSGTEEVPIYDEMGGITGTTTREIDALGRPIGMPGVGRTLGRAAAGLGNVLGLLSDEDHRLAEEALPNDIARAKRRIADLEAQLVEKPAATGTPDYITNPGAYRDPKTTTKPGRMNIENAKELGDALARALATTKLNVVVSNPIDASRGPEKIGGEEEKPSWYDIL